MATYSYFRDCWYQIATTIDKSEVDLRGLNLINTLAPSISGLVDTSACEDLSTLSMK